MTIERHRPPVERKTFQPMGSLLTHVTAHLGKALQPTPLGPKKSKQKTRDENERNGKKIYASLETAPQKTKTQSFAKIGHPMSFGGTPRNDFPPSDHSARVRERDSLKPPIYHGNKNLTHCGTIKIDASRHLSASDSTKDLSRSRHHEPKGKRAMPTPNGLSDFTSNAFSVADSMALLEIQKRAEEVCTGHNAPPAQSLAPDKPCDHPFNKRNDHRIEPPCANVLPPQAPFAIGDNAMQDEPLPVANAESSHGLSAEEIWSLWTRLAHMNLGPNLYGDWMQQLKILSWKNNILTLQAPSVFVAQWIETHYLDPMKTWMRQQYPPLSTVCIVCQEGGQSTYAFSDQKSPDSQENSVARERKHPRPEWEKSAVSAATPSEGASLYSTEEEAHIQSSPLNATFTFEQFVVGKPNEFAYAAARRVAESEEAIYNPLFLYGPVGHGKTHLMHSIAHTIQERANGEKTILYLSAEKFMYYFVRALRYRNVMAFKERFRSVDVLMIDDVQFISGKDSTQEEFFHTFNSLVDNRRQVVISADKSPSDLEGIQERMKSRLGWGLAVDLHPTTYELRLGILQAKAAAQGYSVAGNILEFLAENIVSSVRELEGALTRIIAHSTLVGKALTVDFVRTVLRDILRPQSAALTLEIIEKKVCEYFHLRITDLHSAKRTRAITRPRQIAMFLAKTLTATSLPAIGRHFGGRDHTTVLHGVSAIETLMQSDAEIQESVRTLRQSLEGR